MEDLKAVASFLSYNTAGVLLEDLGPYIQDGSYRHEWKEGPHYAEFRITSDLATDDYMRDFFASRIMTRFSFHYGGGFERWRGKIGYMRLTLGGVSYIRDARKVINRVKTEYTSINDDVSMTRYTPWYENEESLTLYGPSESTVRFSGRANSILTSEDGVPIYNEVTDAALTEIDQMAIDTVARNAYPFTRQISPSNDKSELLVMAFGPQVFAENILISDGYLENNLRDGLSGLRDAGDEYEDWVHGEHANASDYPVTVSGEFGRIVDLVDTVSSMYLDMPILYALDISDANELQTVAGVTSPSSAWKRLKELALLKDTNDKYYRLEVDLDGGVIYQPYSYTPVYYLTPPPGGLQTKDGKSPTWDAKPEMTRILDQHPQLSQPGGWLEDGNLIMPSRVTMRDGTEFPVFGDDELTEADYLAAYEANSQLIERMKR